MLAHKHHRESLGFWPPLLFTTNTIPVDDIFAFTAQKKDPVVNNSDRWFFVITIFTSSKMPTSELKVAEKWDTAMEKGIKRTAYGAIAGGVVAALLFRTYLFFLALSTSTLLPHPSPTQTQLDRLKFCDKEGENLTYFSAFLDGWMSTCAGVGGVGIRSMIIGLGAGTGIGITYSEAKRDFEELAPATTEAQGQI